MNRMQELQNMAS